MLKGIKIPVGTVRAVLAFMIVGAIFALSIMQIDVPGQLWGIGGAVVGFFFAQQENGVKRNHELRMKGN